MILLSVLAGAVILWVLHGYLPVPSLYNVHGIEWVDSNQNNPNVKILDVRDASDYLERHVPGSINISLGRLPYVWHKELSQENKVVILSASRYQRNKAARILHKRGFRQLYAVKGHVFMPTGKRSNAEGCGCFGHGYNH
ncbi:rhodanese-like domain-containing protein [Cohnella ginsengisoli]|uniref:Rhodanese-like domain-containing protein n=1 Tax=Cohnella ginsengisoli TaxID=425004 RepID=A0A9X4KKV7_9BACL|nr:rhodanese-like domain-containing protein [Cohnella ginsengisoli]MDG0793943.1 rhodanese-like domain-containing protein [Cohnella ginsengisoli]